MAYWKSASLKDFAVNVFVNLLEDPSDTFKALDIINYVNVLMFTSKSWESCFQVSFISSLKYWCLYITDKFVKSFNSIGFSGKKKNKLHLSHGETLYYKGNACFIAVFQSTVVEYLLYWLFCII